MFPVHTYCNASPQYIFNVCCVYLCCRCFSLGRYEQKKIYISVLSLDSRLSTATSALFISHFNPNRKQKKNGRTTIMECAPSTLEMWKKDNKSEIWNFSVSFHFLVRFFFLFPKYRYFPTANPIMVAGELVSVNRAILSESMRELVAIIMTTMNWDRSVVSVFPQPTKLLCICACHSQFINIFQYIFELVTWKLWDDEQPRKRMKIWWARQGIRSKKKQKKNRKRQRDLPIKLLLDVANIGGIEIERNSKMFALNKSFFFRLILCTFGILHLNIWCGWPNSKRTFTSFSRHTASSVTDEHARKPKCVKQDILFWQFVCICSLIFVFVCCPFDIDHILNETIENRSCIVQWLINIYGKIKRQTARTTQTSSWRLLIN